MMGGDLMSKEKEYNLKSLYFPERITEILNQISEYLLTIIEAPMGYGKTTAIREWLNNTEINYLWQRVYDDSIVNFWQGFVKLLCDLGGESVSSLIRYQFPDDTISIREIIRIIEKIELPNKVILVIDDYHLIDNNVLTN
jgi:LuxR family maltose regulon positive regulatory protein